MAGLPPALGRLAREHPELAVHTRQLEPEDSIPLLRLGELDLVIAQEYPFAPQTVDAAIELTPLREDPIRLAVPITHFTNDFATAYGLVAIGAGFALVPELAGPPPDGVVIVPARRPIPSRRSVAAVRAGSGARPAVRACLDALMNR